MFRPDLGDPWVPYGLLELLWVTGRAEKWIGDLSEGRTQLYKKYPSANPASSPYTKT